MELPYSQLCAHAYMHTARMRVVQISSTRALVRYVKRRVPMAFAVDTNNATS